MNTHSCLLTISNKRGLHARASASFATLAGSFPCDISLGHPGAPACNGKNILEVMMLAAAPGTQLQLQTSGEQAEAALLALQQLVNDRFHEDDLPG